ncbi:unnamed protein product [Lactuca saligna]|uniref:Uncharacterized protein n=1 Tax=Lactuca saligna TaxID=75948 RepID=A0AA35YUC5_LACSI|nr:unnamed protein product [Lactuca saligna]
MRTFHNSFYSNTTNWNEVISSFRSTLHIEKDALEKVHYCIHSDNSEINSSITSKIDKLHQDLDFENVIMDKLTVKTEKVKVLTVKLEQVEKQINELLYEKDAMKSCIADVNSLLSDIIKTRDSLITITIKKHLAEKLRHVFAKLNRLEGVSESSSLPKQGEKLNSQDSQLDLPITLKAFEFRSFIKVVNVPLTDSGADHLLFSFYSKHTKPQYETWSAKKITFKKVSGPIETDSFPNAHFKVARGSTSQVCKFTLADLPFLNPYDWILLLNMLLKDEPVVAHLKRMLISYIQEVGKMDVEIASVLRKRFFAFPKEAPEDYDKMM